MAKQSTGRIRRNPATPTPVEQIAAGSRFRWRVPAVPPAPVIPPRPHGDLSRAPVEQIADLVGKAWPAPVTTTRERTRAVRALLRRLEQFGGQTWQQRWDASPYADGAVPVDDLPLSRPSQGGGAAKMLLCLRVLRPTLPALHALRITGYAEMFRLAQADPDLDRFFDRLDATAVLRSHRLTAAFDIACMLTVYGLRFAELSPEAVLHYAWETRRRGMVVRARGVRHQFGGKLVWKVLHAMGHFPSGTPATLTDAGKRGRLSVAELVDRHEIASQQVRQLLIDYLSRRAAEMDYTSLVSLARLLAGTFWSKIEKLSPGQADLRLPLEVYDQWRAAIRLREDGKPRLSVDPILLAVRSFYLDLHTWSVAEPQRWAQWVAPCPIGPGDLVGSARRARRARERSADRTRARQPLLPALVDHVTSRHRHLRGLLKAATDAQPEQLLRVDERTYRRVWTGQDTHYLSLNRKPRIRVRDEDSGKIVNVALAEEAAFWDWAVIEVLRHTGARVEEVIELTQLSVRRYIRPNGETVALLVIAPSKTDRERVIPMTAELFTVVAAIIRRHLDTTGHVPAISRYDDAEKLHSPALPFLFQRQRGVERAVFNTTWVLDMLKKRCRELAATHPEFATSTFTPHDFRRIFATDLVNNGLPIHIGAALLGHLNLETTRGYVAVFEEDLVRHYQAFLNRRRKLRPAEEYRPATDTEWAEFEAHFDKRKVELGNCGRPYGTPCIHEHACIRCPMLHVNPAMLPRLDQIEADLRSRRDRAQAENWLGEVEGIDLTLSHLDTKRRQALRAQPDTSGPVLLGMPAIGDPNNRPDYQEPT